MAVHGDDARLRERRRRGAEANRMFWKRRKKKGTEAPSPFSAVTAQIQTSATLEPCVLGPTLRMSAFANSFGIRPRLYRRQFLYEKPHLSRVVRCIYLNFQIVFRILLNTCSIDSAFLSRRCVKDIGRLMLQ